MSLPHRARRRMRRWRLQRSLARYRPLLDSGFEMFSDDRSEHGGDVLAQIPPADVVHLHWVAGMFDVEAFFPSVPARVPVVWTIHDMNPFTGGCHYDLGCGRYVDGCGRCPALGSGRLRDLSRAILRRKVRALQGVDPARLHVVTPSRWLHGEAVRARPTLGRFSMSVIPYGLDLETFAPRDRMAARELLGLPPDASIVLFVADFVDNSRKGFALMAEALRDLEKIDRLLVVSAGHGVPGLADGVPHTHLGFVGNDRLLSLVYSAADLLVLASLQDNLPNTALESLACGTPVVGFAVGGVPDVVRDGVTGFLAAPLDVGGLRAAIVEGLQDPARRALMGAAGRQVAIEQYGLSLQTERYLQLYAAVRGEARVRSAAPTPPRRPPTG
jgi:glycosyltransferase involved in cell wall biosynthesis